MQTAQINEALKEHNFSMIKVDKDDNAYYFIYEFTHNNNYYADVFMVHKNRFIVKSLNERILKLKEKIDLKIIYEPIVFNIEIDDFLVVTYLVHKDRFPTTLSNFSIVQDGKHSYANEDEYFTIYKRFRKHECIYKDIDKILSNITISTFNDDLE